MLPDLLVERLERRFVRGELLAQVLLGVGPARGEARDRHRRIRLRPLDRGDRDVEPPAIRGDPVEARADVERPAGRPHHLERAAGVAHPEEVGGIGGGNNPAERVELADQPARTLVAPGGEGLQRLVLDGQGRRRGEPHPEVAAQRGAHAALQHRMRGHGRPEQPPRSDGHVEAERADHQRPGEVFGQRDAPGRGGDHLHGAAGGEIAPPTRSQRLGDHGVERGDIARIRLQVFFCGSAPAFGTTRSTGLAAPPDSVAPELFEDWSETLIRPVT